MSTELKGSPKQISWAKRIRTDRLSSWKKSDPEMFMGVESSLNDETSAPWWITHREKELKEVIPYIVEGGEMKATMKPKAAKAPSPTVAALPTNKESFSGLDAVHRNIGEVRDVVTGKVVVDPVCPF